MASPGSMHATSPRAMSPTRDEPESADLGDVSRLETRPSGPSGSGHGADEQAASRLDPSGSDLQDQLAKEGPARSAGGQDVLTPTTSGALLLPAEASKAAKGKAAARATGGAGASETPAVTSESGASGASPGTSEPGASGNPDTALGASGSPEAASSEGAPGASASRTDAPNAAAAGPTASEASGSGARGTAEASETAGATGAAGTAAVGPARDIVQGPGAGAQNPPAPGIDLMANFRAAHPAARANARRKWSANPVGAWDSTFFSLRSLKDCQGKLAENQWGKRVAYQAAWMANKMMAPAFVPLDKLLGNGQVHDTFWATQSGKVASGTSPAAGGLVPWCARGFTYAGALVGASIGLVAESIEEKGQTRNYAAAGATVGAWITCAITQLSVGINLALKSVLALQMLIPFATMAALFYAFSFASWSYNEAMKHSVATGPEHRPGPQPGPQGAGDTAARAGGGHPPEAQAAAQAAGPSQAASAGEQPVGQASGTTGVASAGRASKPSAGKRPNGQASGASEKASAKQAPAASTTKQPETHTPGVAATSAAGQAPKAEAPEAQGSGTSATVHQADEPADDGRLSEQGNRTLTSVIGTLCAVVRRDEACQAAFARQAQTTPGSGPLASSTAQLRDEAAAPMRPTSLPRKPRPRKHGQKGFKMRPLKGQPWLVK